VSSCAFGMGLLVITPAIVYMFYKGIKTTMHDYLTYLAALNAFWPIGWSVHGIVKYKRKNNPILK